MAADHKLGEANEIGEARIGGSPNQSPSETDMASIDVDLALIAAAWPSLPEAIRAGIVAMVQAAVPDQPRSWASEEDAE